MKVKRYDRRVQRQKAARARLPYFVIGRVFPGEYLEPTDSFAVVTHPGGPPLELKA